LRSKNITNKIGHGIVMLGIVEEAFILEYDMKVTSHQDVKSYAKEVFIFEFDVFC
jgi:hypothetical protein